MTKRKAKFAPKPARELPRWRGFVNKLPPELRQRVYCPPVGVHGTVGPFRMYGGTGWQPLCVEVMLETGWCVPGLDLGEDCHTHHLNVFDENGGNVEYRMIRADLKSRVRRCYCTTCLQAQPLDDEYRTRLRAVLELRAAVARANSIPLTGLEHDEARIDAILNGKEEPDGHASL